jgi:DNA repair protein RadC
MQFKQSLHIIFDFTLHNHPSGDCTPSAEDKDATRRLIRSGELLGIPLLDHLIVADSGFFSFREHGLLA